MVKIDIAIIGAGPVGLFSIFQAGMLGMRCAVIDTLEVIGGQCSALYPEKPIYDIPAYPKIMAADLIQKLAEQAEPFAPIYHLGQQVVAIIKQNEQFIVKTSLGVEIEAKAVVIAAGCGAFGPNRPPLEGIDQYEGKSVFYLVNKREQFAGKNIAIAGGGDSAIDWTLSLAEIANKIYLIHRRDKFRCAPASFSAVKALSQVGKVELVVPYQLKALHGKDGYLQQLEVYDLTGASRNLEIDVLLPFFGLAMELGPIRDWGLNLSQNHITVNQTTAETNIPGIYAIGDIATYPGKLKLILSGFAEAATALHHAYNRVFDGKPLHFEYSTSKGVNL